MREGELLRAAAEAKASKTRGESLSMPGMLSAARSGLLFETKNDVSRMDESERIARQNSRLNSMMLSRMASGDAEAVSDSSLSDIDKCGELPAPSVPSVESENLVRSHTTSYSCRPSSEELVRRRASMRSTRSVRFR
uniref:Uncharacterized protein n=1 Tax=Timspurckia oligopyrenoides TaxID=708627 RepID=A0A7S1EUX2_9RHOD